MKFCSEPVLTIQLILDVFELDDPIVIIPTFIVLPILPCPISTYVIMYDEPIVILYVFEVFSFQIELVILLLFSSLTLWENMAEIIDT